MSNPSRSLQPSPHHPLLSLSSIDLPSSTYEHSEWSDNAGSPLSASNLRPPLLPLSGQANTEEPEEEGSTLVFNQLEVIKRIQNDIASTHFELDGVGNTDKKRERDDSWWTDAKLDLTLGPASELKSKAEREKTIAAYESMAAEFDARQEGVSKILEKVGLQLQAPQPPHVRAIPEFSLMVRPVSIEQLADLTAAVKAFHALPSPVLFPSRTTKSQSKDGSGARGRAVSEDSQAKPIQSSSIF